MKWYETKRFSEDVTLILESWIDPGWRCNIWHIRGRDRDLLVDSGMGLKPIKAEVALVTEKPLACVASHAHFDHVGGHWEFDERICHRAEASILAAPDRRNTVADGFVDMAWFAAIPDNPCAPGDYNVKPAPATRTVDEGDVIDLGNRSFEVMHLPGHSPGSIALWEAATATLFSGDVIYDGELFDHLYHSHVPTYEKSLKRLLELPADTVHAGHFGSFGRARLIELIEANLERWEQNARGD